MERKVKLENSAVQMSAGVQSAMRELEIAQSRLSLQEDKNHDMPALHSSRNLTTEVFKQAQFVMDDDKNKMTVQGFIDHHEKPKRVKTKSSVFQAIGTVFVTVGGLATAFGAMWFFLFPLFTSTQILFALLSLLLVTFMAITRS